MDIISTDLSSHSCFKIPLRPPTYWNHKTLWQRRIRNSYIYLPLRRKNSSYLINERHGVELSWHLTLRAPEERGSAPVKAPGRGNMRACRVPAAVTSLDHRSHIHLWEPAAQFGPIQGQRLWRSARRRSLWRSSPLQILASVSTMGLWEQKRGLSSRRQSYTLSWLRFV